MEEDKDDQREVLGDKLDDLNVQPGDRRSADLQVCTQLPLDKARRGFDLPIFIISLSFLKECYILYICTSYCIRSYLLNQEIISAQYRRAHCSLGK